MSGATGSDPGGLHGDSSGPLAGDPRASHRDDPLAPHRDDLGGPDGVDPLAPHRDDGPLGLLARPRAGRSVLVPEVVVLVLAVLLALGPPLVGALRGGWSAAVTGPTGEDPAAAVVLGLPGWAWVTVAVVVAALARFGRRLARLDWPIPALLRALEYGGVLVLTGGGPASYLLLAVLAFRHYDIVYRLRTLGVAPPRWLAVATGGWPVRLLVLAAAGGLGVLGPTVVVLTVVLAGVVVPESLTCWLADHRRHRSDAHP